jgi:hypothetical protein
MVGGRGINSPHPPTSRYRQLSAHWRTGQSGAPPVRQLCANGHFQWLVLTTSRWTHGTPESEQSLSGAQRTVLCDVWCAVRCATKIHLWNLRSRVSRWRKIFPGPARPHLAEGAPDCPVHTGQSGAPGPETLTLVFQLIFKSVFVLTCEWVLEWHLALYVSVIVHQHYTRTLLVKLLIDNPSL